MREGWHLIAFDREVGDGLVILPGATPLIGLRTRKGIRVFDAICPHRGAHLGVGGRPDGDAIICPYHGKRIALGADVGGFAVREYACLMVGGLVFVQTCGSFDFGFREFISKLDAANYVIPGFQMTAATTSEIVIENAFDTAHFRPVHGVQNEPTLVRLPSEKGEFVARGAMTVPLSQWQRGPAEYGRLSVPYVARAFGRGVVISQMGGRDPYWVITGALPTGPHQCEIRVAIAVPPGPDHKPPAHERCAYLMRQIKVGLEQDRVIWDQLQNGFSDRLDAGDKLVAEFRLYLDTLGRGDT